MKLQKKKIHKIILNITYQIASVQLRLITRLIIKTEHSDSFQRY